MLLKSNNVTTVAYINHLGGTKSKILANISKNIWLWCLQRGITLKAQHLPGKENLKADFISPFEGQNRLGPQPSLVQPHQSDMDPLLVDLFATRFSHQLPRFFGWHPDPEVEATDAFLQDWRNLQAYAHPPWCLITRVLGKALCQRVTLVLVTPCWPTQPWFPQLMGCWSISLLFSHTLPKVR